MTLALKLLCRVVLRRMEAGENPEMILADYPRLTAAEYKLLTEELSKQV